MGGAQFASNHRKRLRAQAELAAISSALESYRREFGDYPRTSDAAEFLQALIGRRNSAGVAVTSRCRLELDRFHTCDDRDPFVDQSAELIDPWERSYVYAHKTSGAWTNPSCVLFSHGSDGLSAALPASGFVDTHAAENLDNVYATP